MVIALCALSFFIGRASKGDKTIKEIKSDTVRIVFRDTIVKERVKPTIVYKERVIVDTLFSIDSVLVEVLVPIEKKIFQDSNYKAEISGYKVSLDRMEVYPRTEQVIINRPVTQYKRSKIGLGISAGYSITPKGFQPYIGVGLNYNIITFK